jgi:hypothetical protein
VACCLWVEGLFAANLYYVVVVVTTLKGLAPTDFHREAGRAVNRVSVAPLARLFSVKVLSIIIVASVAVHDVGGS